MCGVPVLQPEIRGKINQGNGLPFLSDLLYEEHLEDLKTTFMVCSIESFEIEQRL